MRTALFAIVTGAVVGLAAPGGAEPPKRCKSPKVYYQGDCRYPDDVAKLKEAARKKKEAAEKKKEAAARKKREAAARRKKQREADKREAKTRKVDERKTERPKERKAKTRKTRPTPSGKLLTLGDMRWVRVPGGTFRMGYEHGDADETPVHQVTVSPVLMTRSEVTVAQYAECVEAGYCRTDGLETELERGGSPKASKQCNWGQAGYEAHPLNCVSWQQAQDFCTWVGGRLPTEAEWEHAATGGRSQMYPWGDDLATCSKAVLDNGTDGCGMRRTSAVCLMTAGLSPQGLCDMAGNVWEWTGDWYQPTYYAQSRALKDPKGPDIGGQRVRRGGSFKDRPQFIRSANRFALEPNLRDSNTGFRCAADARAASGDASRNKSGAAAERHVKDPYHQGRAALKRGDLREAVGYLDAAARGGHGKAYKHLGVAYLRHGETPKAIQSFRRYLRTVPLAKDVASVRSLIIRLGDTP